MLPISGADYSVPEPDPELFLQCLLLLMTEGADPLLHWPGPGVADPDPVGSGLYGSTRSGFGSELFRTVSADPDPDPVKM